MVVSFTRGRQMLICLFLSKHQHVASSAESLARPPPFWPLASRDREQAPATGHICYSVDPTVRGLAGGGKQSVLDHSKFAKLCKTPPHQTTAGIHVIVLKTISANPTKTSTLSLCLNHMHGCLLCCYSLTKIYGNIHFQLCSVPWTHCY